MSEILLKDKPYERFSLSPLTGLGPGLTVTLHMPVSGRKITDRRALIDPGAERTCIYSRDVDIEPSEVDYDPETETVLVGVEVGGRIYYAQCRYWDHPYGGTEHMLIGMDLLSNWLVEPGPFSFTGKRLLKMIIPICHSRERGNPCGFA